MWRWAQTKKNSMVGVWISSGVTHFVSANMLACHFFFCKGFCKCGQEECR